MVNGIKLSKQVLAVLNKWYNA